MACEYHFQQHQDNPGLNFSQKIDCIVSFIHKLGFEVNLFDLSLERGEHHAVMGGIWYDKRRISLNCLCAGCAVVVLLHEAGHAICHLANIPDSTNGAKRAEPLADMFGRHLGKVLNLNIPEDDWIIHRQTAIVND